MDKKIRRCLPWLLLLLLFVTAMPQQTEAAVKINKTSVSVNVSKTVTLKVTGTKAKVTWKSSNIKVATVNSKGVVKGVKKGTATITATVSKKTLKCKVTVKQPVTGLKLNKSSISVHKGSSITLKATATPSTANNKAVTWKSNNTKIATVNSNGVIKGVNKGTATITATAKDGSGKKASCKVTVTAPAHTHTWIDVTKTVHHDEKSHTEKKQVGTKTVVDQEAWDEDVYKNITKCSVCGYQSESSKDVAHHTVDEHDGEASYSTEAVKVDTIHHDAVTHEEPIYEDVKVVDKEAWDETVVTGQKCSGCGVAK